MAKKIFGLGILTLMLVFGVASVLAQNYHASTTDAYNAGFIQGRGASSSVSDGEIDSAATAYMRQFLNNQGFNTRSQAYITVKAAFVSGFRDGLAASASLRGN